MYRISINETTGFSPFFILHGFEPRMPTEMFHSLRHADFEDEAVYTKRVTGILKDVFELVRERQDRASAIWRKRRDTNEHRVEPMEYKPNDPVCVWKADLDPEYVKLRRIHKTPPKPKRFTLMWTGPHLIEKKITDLRYIVTHAKRGPIMVGITRLHPAYVWSEEVPDTAPSWSSNSLVSLGPWETTEKRVAPVGSLVLIPMRQKDAGDEPFRIARLLEIDKNSHNIVVHWYGNYRFTPTGKWQPVWTPKKLKRNLDTTSEGKTRKTLKEWKCSVSQPVGFGPLTNLVDQIKLTQNNICFHGFTLTSHHCIPKSLLDNIAQSPYVDWNT
jgi:hypothetical protein